MTRNTPFISEEQQQDGISGNHARWPESAMRSACGWTSTRQKLAEYGPTIQHARMVVITPSRAGSAMQTLRRLDRFLSGRRLVLGTERQRSTRGLATQAFFFLLSPHTCLGLRFSYISIIRKAFMKVTLRESVFFKSVCCSFAGSLLVGPACCVICERRITLVDGRLSDACHFPAECSTYALVVSESAQCENRREDHALVKGKYNGCSHALLKSVF